MCDRTAEFKSFWICLKSLSSSLKQTHHTYCYAPFSCTLCGFFVFGLIGITLPCTLFFRAWLSSLLGARCPSSAHQDTACLPEDSPCHLNPPRVRPWSLVSSAPLSGLSCCCSLWAVSDWKRLCGGDGNVVKKAGSGYRGI